MIEKENDEGVPLYEKNQEEIEHDRKFMIEKDLGGTLLSYDKFYNIFPEFCNWLVSLYGERYISDFFIFLQKDNRYTVNFYSETNEYNIALTKPHGGDKGYCGGFYVLRKPLVGETWKRGGDLADGKYCEETFIRLEKDIVRNEIKKLEINL